MTLTLPHEKSTTDSQSHLSTQTSQQGHTSTVALSHTSTSRSTTTVRPTASSTTISTTANSAQPPGQTDAQGSGTTTSAPTSSKVIAAAVACALLALATCAAITLLLCYNKRKKDDICSDEEYAPCNAPVHHVYPGETPEFFSEKSSAPCNLIDKSVKPAAALLPVLPSVTGPVLSTKQLKDGELPPLRNAPRINPPQIDVQVIDYDDENTCNDKCLSVPSV